MNQLDHPVVSRPDEGFDPAADHEFVSASLIEPHADRGERKDIFLAYKEPDFENSSENPYRDTTESDINIRHIPLGDLVPRPWKTFQQVMIASYISVVICFITGIFAVRYAWRGKRHQSKGLMGMAQRDLNLAVWFVYASAAFGAILYLIIIPIAANV